MNILLQYIIILDLPMEARIVHTYKDIINAQKVTQQHKETGGHHTLQRQNIKTARL